MSLKFRFVAMHNATVADWIAGLETQLQPLLGDSVLPSPIRIQIETALRALRGVVTSPDTSIQTYTMVTNIVVIEDSLASLNSPLQRQYDTAAIEAALETRKSSLFVLIKIRAICHDLGNSLMKLMGIEDLLPDYDFEPMASLVTRENAQITKIINLDHGQMTAATCTDFISSPLIVELAATIEAMLNLLPVVMDLFEATSNPAWATKIKQSISQISGYLYFLKSPDRLGRPLNLRDFVQTLTGNCQASIEADGELLTALDDIAFRLAFDIIYDNCRNYGKFPLKIDIRKVSDSPGSFIQITLRDSGTGYDWAKIGQATQTEYRLDHLPSPEELRSHWLLHVPRTSSHPRDAHGRDRHSIGLALVNCIINAYGGGQVQILENHPDGGAQIQLRLPLLASL